MASSSESVHFEELSRDLRASRRDLLAQTLPATGEDRLEHLVSELQVRELLAAFCYARDSLDRGWLGSLFGDRLDQALALDDVRFSHSRFANPVVRFEPGFERGLVSSYFHTGSMDGDGKTRSRFGILMAQVVRLEGAWRLGETKLGIGAIETFSPKPLVTLWNDRLPQQPRAGHTDIQMSDSRRLFYEVSEGGFGGARWLLDHPPAAGTREEKLKLLADNLAIRDCFSRYVNAYDSSDVARVMEKVVATEVLQLSRRDDAASGLVFMSGKDEAREQYRIWNASRRISFHRVANVIARFLPDVQECWAAAYYNAPIVGHTNEFQSQFGGYFFRFVREEDDWRLADRRLNGPNGGGMVVFPFVTPELGTAGAWNGRAGH
jgi:hypothetical protein